MRELTFTELEMISAGINGSHGGINGWRAGFDIAAGGLLGAVIGGIWGLNMAAPVGIEGLAFLFLGGFYANAIGGAIIGLGIGVAAGALFALGREVITH